MVEGARTKHERARANGWRCRVRCCAPGIGFTLIEVLVVLAVLAAVAATAVPALGRAAENARFGASAREIANALKTARHDAVAQQREATFTLDVELRSYGVNAGPRRLLGAPRDAFFTLDTAESERVSATSGSIRFFADGSSTGGAVTVALRERRYVVAVDWLTGRVEVRGR